MFLELRVITVKPLKQHGMFWQCFLVTSGLSTSWDCCGLLRMRELSYIILICALKRNEGLKELEQHKGKKLIISVIFG